MEVEEEEEFLKKSFSFVVSNVHVLAPPPFLCAESLTFFPVDFSQNLIYK